MRLLFASLLVLIAPTLVLSSPAKACTYSIAKSSTPKAIKRRADVRKINGRFYVDRVTRSADYGSFHGEIYGHIVTAKGQTMLTNHEWNEPAIACGFYSKPLKNAEGSFYIQKSKKGGPSKMLFWEGRYTDADKNPEFEIPPLPNGDGK
jgi:hypothetical protein